MPASRISTPLSVIQFLSPFELVPTLLSVIRMPVCSAAPLSDFTNLLRQSRRVSDVTVRRLIRIVRPANAFVYTEIAHPVYARMEMRVICFNRLVLALFVLDFGAIRAYRLGV